VKDHRVLQSFKNIAMLLAQSMGEEKKEGFIDNLFPWNSL
jgi:hypothetical protein